MIFSFHWGQNHPQIQDDPQESIQESRLVDATEAVVRQDQGPSLQGELPSGVPHHRGREASRGGAVARDIDTWGPP